MRAPFANWTEELNDTDSDEFANMEKQVKLGVSMLSQRQRVAILQVTISQRFLKIARPMRKNNVFFS